jgi:hypothetical protein
MILDAVLRVHYRGGDDSMAVLDNDTIRRIRRKTCVHISHNNRDKHSLDIAPAGIHTECIRDDRFHGVTLAFFCPAQDERRGDIAFLGRKRPQVPFEAQPAERGHRVDDCLGSIRVVPADPPDAADESAAQYDEGGKSEHGNRGRMFYSRRKSTEFPRL